MKGEIDNSKLFFKVWRNKFVRNIILSNLQTGEYLNSRWETIDKRLDYNFITSLEWMLDNRQYSMIIDKVNSKGTNVHITEESISKLIEKCTNNQVYQVLFSKKRKELEKVDLIFESIKLDSVYALDKFITLYGGVEVVIKEWGLPTTGSTDGPINNHLIDYSIKCSSLKVASYLLGVNGLNGYTESRLIKNSLTFNTHANYYNYNYNRPSPRNKKDLANSLDNKIDSGLQSIIFNTSNRYNAIRRRSMTYNSKAKLDLANNLKFIREKLNLSIEQLIVKYKNDQNSKSPSSLIQILDESLIAVFLLNDYYHYDSFYKYVPNNTINIGYDANYIKFLALNDELISLRSRRGKGTKYVSALKKISNEMKEEKDTTLSSTSQLIERYGLSKASTTNLIPIQFSKYYIDSIFFSGSSDLTLISTNYSKLFPNFENETMLFTDTFLTFSKDGFEVLKRVYKDCQAKHETNTNVNKGQFKFTRSMIPQRLTATQEQPGSTIEETNLKRQLKIQSKLKSLSDEELIEFINLVTGKNIDEKLFPIPWDSMFSILVKYSTVETIYKLIDSNQYFKQLFIHWIKNNSNQFFALICEPTLDSEVNHFKNKIITKCCLNGCNCKINGEIDFGKLEFFFQFQHTPNDNFNNIVPYRLSNGEKVKLVNWLFQHTDEFTKLFSLPYHYFQYLVYMFNCGSQNAFQSGTNCDDKLFTGLPPSIEESILIYTSLDIQSINKSSLLNSSNIKSPSLVKQVKSGIQREFTLSIYNLENFFFDSILNHSITSSEKSIENVATILSIVNKVPVESIKLPDINPIASGEIKFIEYLITNQLLVSFGSNLLLLLIKSCIISLKQYYQKGGLSNNNQIEYNEHDLIELVKLVNKQYQINHDVIDHLNESLIEISLDANLFTLFSHLNNNRKIGHKTNANEQIEAMDKLKYQQKQTKYDAAMKNSTILDGALKLFKLGYPEYLINYYKVENSKPPVFTPNNQHMYRFRSRDTNMENIENLATQYCNIQLWKEFYTHIFQDKIDFNTLLGDAILFNRLDIVEFLFDEFEVTPNQHHLFMEVFTGGYVQIANYLLKNQPQLFIENGKTSALSPLSPNLIVKESLVNGHCDLFDLIIETFPDYQFSLGKSVINVVITNGHYNVISHLFSIGKLIDLNYIVNSKSAIATKGKFTIEISTHLFTLVNSIIVKQQLLNPSIVTTNTTTSTTVSKPSKKRTLDNDNNNDDTQQQQQKPTTTAISPIQTRSKKQKN